MGDLTEVRFFPMTIRGDFRCDSSCARLSGDIFLGTINFGTILFGLPSLSEFFASSLSEALGLVTTRLLAIGRILVRIFVLMICSQQKNFRRINFSFFAIHHNYLKLKSSQQSMET
jgi:hypothetical protein